jgi:hypothetical protein
MSGDFEVSNLCLFILYFSLCSRQLGFTEIRVLGETSSDAVKHR